MSRNLWTEFPQQLIDRINGLLDQAHPNSHKAFQLYRSCKNENLWSESFEIFNSKISDFFLIHRLERRKSFIDQFLNRPMDSFIYEEFHLTFRTATVAPLGILAIAQWAANQISSHLKINSELISETILNNTIHELTHPRADEKDSAFEFEDFCEKFKSHVQKLFGRKHDQDLNFILKELRWLSQQNSKEENQIIEIKPMNPGLYLTQTEINWVSEIEKSVLQNVICPKFPLSRGPTKLKLIDLDRAATLYNLVHQTTLPELMKQQPQINNTLLQICEFLLKDKASSSRNS
jgi:hypothetical protein